MAENQKDTVTKETPTKDERLALLEAENVLLKEAVIVCLEALHEGAVYGNIKRSREAFLKGALDILKGSAP